MRETTLLAVFTIHVLFPSRFSPSFSSFANKINYIRTIKMINKINTQSECPTAKAARYFIGQMMEQVTDGHCDWNGQINFLRKLQKSFFFQVTYGSFEFVLQTNESAGRNSFSDIIWPLKSAMGECWRGPYGQRVASGALKRPAYSLFFLSSQLNWAAIILHPIP